MTNFDCSEELGNLPKKMSWKRWPTMAMRNELRLVSWPAEVMPPGPDFDVKMLGTALLRKLVGDHIKYTQDGQQGPPPDTLGFEKWTAGESLVHLLSSLN